MKLSKNRQDQLILNNSITEIEINTVRGAEDFNALLDKLKTKYLLSQNHP